MSLSSLPPGWTPERPSPLPPVSSFRRPDPPHAPTTPSPLSPFSTSPPPSSSAFNAPRTPISHAYSSSHYYRPPRSTFTSPNRSNYSSPSVSPTRSSRRSRIQALLATDPLLARLTPATIRQLSQDTELGFTPGDREWSLRAAEGIVKVGEWLREVEGWNVGWGRGQGGEGYLPPEPGQRKKRRKISIEEDWGMRTIQEEDELMASPQKTVRRKLFSDGEISPVNEQTSPPLGTDSPRTRTSGRPISALKLKQHRRSVSDVIVDSPGRASPPDPESSPRRRSMSVGGQLGDSSEEEDEDEEYFGCLPRSAVESYEMRIEMIKADIEELDIEGLKGKVLSYRTGIDNPLTSSSAIITATTLQLLPPLYRLTKLLSLWAIRLAVLKIVPVFLRWLENAKVALEAGVAAIQHPEVVKGNQKLDEEVFGIMSETIQQKVATAGRIMDTMLDALEGREDVLPDQWIGELEDIEEGYSRWQMDAERIVLEGRLRTSSRDEDLQAGRERAQLILENEKVVEEAREDEDAIGDVMERFEDMEKGLMEAMEMHEEVQEGIEIQGEEDDFDHEHEIDHAPGLGLGLDDDLMRMLSEVETDDVEEERGRRWSRAGSPSVSARDAFIQSPDLNIQQAVSEFQHVLEPIRRKMSEELPLTEKSPLAPPSTLSHSVAETPQPTLGSGTLGPNLITDPTSSIVTPTEEIDVHNSADDDMGPLRHLDSDILGSTSDIPSPSTDINAITEVDSIENVQLAPSLDSRDSEDGSDDSSTRPISSRSSTQFEGTVQKHDNNNTMPVVSLSAVVRDTALVRDLSPVDSDVNETITEDENAEVHTPRVTSSRAVAKDTAIFKTPEKDAQTQADRLEPEGLKLDMEIVPEQPSPDNLIHPSPVVLGAHSLPEMLWTQPELLTPRPNEPEALLTKDLPESLPKEEAPIVSDTEHFLASTEYISSSLRHSEKPSPETASDVVDLVESRDVSKTDILDEVVPPNDEVNEVWKAPAESLFTTTGEHSPILPVGEKPKAMNKPEQPSSATRVPEVVIPPSPEKLAEELGQSAAAVSDLVDPMEQRNVARIDESDVVPASSVDAERRAKAAASLSEISEVENAVAPLSDSSISETAQLPLRSPSPEQLAEDTGRSASAVSDQVDTVEQRAVAKVDESDVVLPPPVDTDRWAMAAAALVEETRPMAAVDANPKDSSPKAVITATEDSLTKESKTISTEPTTVDDGAVVQILRAVEDGVGHEQTDSRFPESRTKEPSISKLPLSTSRSDNRECPEEQLQTSVREPKLEPASPKTIEDAERTSSPVPVVAVLSTTAVVDPQLDEVVEAKSNGHEAPVAEDLPLSTSNKLADYERSYDLVEVLEINESSFVLIDSEQTPQAVVSADANPSQVSGIELKGDTKGDQPADRSVTGPNTNDIGLLIQDQLGRQPSLSAIHAFTEEVGAKLSPHQTPRSGTPSLLPSPVIRSKSPEFDRFEDKEPTKPTSTVHRESRPTSPKLDHLDERRLSTVDSVFEEERDDEDLPVQSNGQDDVILPSLDSPVTYGSSAIPVVLEYETEEIIPKTPAVLPTLLSSPIKGSPVGPSPRIVKEIETAPNVWTSSRASISDEEYYDDHSDGEYERDNGHYLVRHHNDSPRKSDQDPRSPVFEEPDSLEELYSSMLTQSPDDNPSSHSYDDFDFDIRPLATSTPPTHSGRRRVSVSVPTELPSISELSTPRSQKSAYFGSAEKSEVFRTPSSPGMGLRNEPRGSTGGYDDGNASGFSTLVGDDHEGGSVKYKAKGKAARNPVQTFFSSPVLPSSEAADDSFNLTPITELPSLGSNHVLTPTIDNGFWDEQEDDMENDLPDKFESSSERGRFEREETPEVETRQEKITLPKRRPKKPLPSAVTPMKSMRRFKESPYSKRSASLTMSDPPKLATPEPRKDLDTRVNDILMSLPRKIKLTASNLQKLNEQSGSRFIPPKQWESAIPAPRSTGSDSHSVGSAAPSYARTTFRRHLPSVQGDIKCYHLHRNDEQPPMKLYVRLVGNDRLVCRVGGGWSDLEEYLKEWAMHHGSKMKAVSETRLEIQDIPTHKGIAGQRTLRPSASNSSLPRLRSPTPSAQYGRSRSPSMNSSRPASPNISPAVRSVSPAFTVAAVPNRRSLGGPILSHADSPTYRHSESPALPTIRRSVSPSLPPLRRDATSFPIPVMHGGHNGTATGSGNKPSPTTPTSLSFPLQPQHELTPPSPHDHTDQSRPGSSSSVGLRHIPSRLSFTESAFDVATGHNVHSSPPQPKPLPLAGPKTRTTKTMTPENQAWVEGMIGQVRKASSERRVSGIFAGSDRGSGSAYAASSVGGDDAEEPVVRRVAETMGRRSMTPTDSRLPERMSGNGTRRVFLKKGTGTGTGGSGRGRGSNGSTSQNGSIGRSGGAVRGRE